MTRAEINGGKYVSGLSLEEIAALWEELKAKSPDYFEELLYSQKLQENEQKELSGGIFRFLLERDNSLSLNHDRWMQLFEDMHLYWGRNISLSRETGQ